MRVTVVGLGPGAGRDLTGRAREALEKRAFFGAAIRI